MRRLIPKKIVFSAAAIMIVLSAFATAQVFDRFFERWSFLFQNDAGTVVASLVLDLKNASQTLEDAATSPERILLQEGTGLDENSREFLAEEIRSQLLQVASFYNLAISRVSTLRDVIGETSIANAYSSESLQFESNEEFFEYVVSRCSVAVRLISESEGSLPDEIWAQLNAIRSELFLIYGIASVDR